MGLKVFVALALMLSLPIVYMTFTWEPGEDRMDIQQDDRIFVPEWKVSDYWTYEILRADGSRDVVTMAVYEVGDVNYMVGVDVRDEALYHSLYNVLPMVGRIQIQDLAIYENGIPKQMYSFPLASEGPFTCDLVGEDMVVEYDFSTDAGWFSSYTVTDSDGSVVYKMSLVDHGTDFKGQVWFMRAKDLYSKVQTGDGIVDFTVDRFLVQGHPTSGEFDFIAYNVDVRTGDHGRAEVRMLDAEGSTVFSGERTSDGYVSTTTALDGTWRIQVTVIGDAEVEVMAAGVIEYTAVL